MPKITPEMIRSARDAFKETAGITIYLPDEGTLDDFEQGRYDGLCAAITSALSAQPVDTRREAFDAGWNMHAALTPAPASSEPVDAPPAPTGDGWRPIETAPKTGKALLDLSYWYHGDSNITEIFMVGERLDDGRWIMEDDEVRTDDQINGWLPIPASAAPTPEGGR